MSKIGNLEEANTDVPQRFLRDLAIHRGAESGSRGRKAQAHRSEAAIPLG